MIFTETTLNDAYTIEPERIEDSRGFFARTFCEREFLECGIVFKPVQTNLSYNRKKHTLRGMHFQALPFEEAKLVQCIQGAIFDVIIDLRPDSSTFNRWTAVELSDSNRKMIYIPKGFAHGFMTLQDETEVSYLMSEYYTPGADRGIRWDDPAFNIDWPADIAVISEKDKNWPAYQTIEDRYDYIYPDSSN